MNLKIYKRGIGWTKLEVTIACKTCGKDFVVPQGKVKFCSDECRAEYFGKYYKSKYLPSPIRKFSCVSCGVEFESKYHGRKYCGKPCSYNPRRWDLRRAIKAPHGCEICSWPYVEQCHIFAARHGGPAKSWNLIYLCRNHHHLFDRVGLSRADLDKLGIGWLAA